MLHCKLLRSPHAARGSSSRSTPRAAQAHPGVHLVLTGADFPMRFGILPVTQDEHPLARRARALRRRPGRRGGRRDEQTATEALRADRRRLRAAADDRLARGGARARPSRASTTTARRATSTSRPSSSATSTEALAKADHVFEDMFFYEGNTHLPIEQHASLAAVDGDGKLTLWSSTQTPHYVHRALARVLQMPAAHIRVIACPTAAASAARATSSTTRSCVAKAALVLGRPVKICLTREEVFYCHRGRHPVLMRLRTGVTQGRHAHRRCTCRRCSTAAPTARTAWPAPSTPARCRRVTYERAALPVRGLPRLHQQAGLRPQARPRHAAAALRPGGPARQDRREARASTRPSCG